MNPLTNITMSKTSLVILAGLKAILMMQISGNHDREMIRSCLSLFIFPSLRVLL